ncbi:hypothetical protein BGW38_004717 [Lunasporangiospora selenospora]|uniref:Prokaryotic-type class I peptide chain release factors domain-containing protein n=1 Tax=Lunasporangiospora selenospora TaxID=979761 RepID=A0A9P6G0R7_9FUNG|nr:hypothetical protein BGW38_004717 [Lunasporangiospora selenospora]
MSMDMVFGSNDLIKVLTALSTPPPSLFGRTLVCSRVHAVTTAPVIRIQSRTYAGQKDAPLVDLDAIRNDENWTDDNGLTMKQREKIENWVLSFTKDSIPKGLLTLNFVRSSGPGGQNVNKVNTKVDMRFVIDEAFWLPEYVRTRLTIMESNKVNKNGEFVLSSDRKRTQMANLDDCLEKLHETLLKAAELCSLPDQETLEKLERM